MYLRSVLRIIDVRHRTDRNPENTVSRRGDSSRFHLAARARKIQEWRRFIVPRTDDERNLVLLLQIVEFFGKRGKVIERANCVSA